MNRHRKLLVEPSEDSSLLSMGRESLETSETGTAQLASPAGETPQKWLNSFWAAWKLQGTPELDSPLAE